MGLKNKKDRKSKTHKKAARGKKKEEPKPVVKQVFQRFEPTFSSSDEDIIKKEQEIVIPSVVLPEQDSNHNIGTISCVKLDPKMNPYDYEQPWDIHNEAVFQERYP